ncbi:hypothetical protein F5883DRAFT_665143 [Diaporthe sp. PMI_573]|nr:hypothetical protein F5883DRAFT_665143 [Diaporthaceae sp. PMI_573]
MAVTQQKVAAQAVTDLVIPLHYFDNSAMFTNITMYAIMVFDEALEPETLRVSLDQLVRRETWQKLGARVRRGLQIGTRGPSCDCRNPEDWAELCCGADAPKSLQDYVSSDRPVTGLHIVSFEDATIVTLHWLHAAADAMALKAILDSWVLILQGREAEVPILHGFDEDPLRELGCHPTEPYTLAGSDLSTLGTAPYVLRNGYNMLLGQKQNKTVCIPAAFLEKLGEKSLQELEDSGNQDSFLTDNDIITAWWSRLAFSHMPPDKPVTIMQAMSARLALEEDLLPPDRLYVSNCLTFTSVLKTKAEVDQSLGLVARDIRRGINKHGTRQQVEAFLNMVRANAWPLGPMPVFFGKPNMHQ